MIIKEFQYPSIYFRVSLFIILAILLDILLILNLLEYIYMDNIHVLMHLYHNYEEAVFFMTNWICVCIYVQIRILNNVDF